MSRWPTGRATNWAASGSAICRLTERRELAAVNHDDTIIEAAAIMARLRCPLAAVMKGDKLIGVISASRLLELALQSG